VKVLNLYGSKIRWIPPEIDKIDSLERFLPFTSYHLNWVLYEILECKNLIESTIRTRALFGNYKGTLHFPSLVGNPIDSQKSIVVYARKQLVKRK
jgi:hypothetical protein